MSKSIAGNRLPKICGADIELGNFILGMDDPLGTGYHASKLLLREIDGVRHSRCYTPSWNGCYFCTPYGVESDDDCESELASSYEFDPQDRGRKFLASNGGCAYIDLDHLELCIPEVRSAWGFVAAWHAMLILGRQAMDFANSKLAAERGSRFSSITRMATDTRTEVISTSSVASCWDNIFRRKLHYLSFLLPTRSRVLSSPARAK